MTANGWIQILLYMAVIFAVTKPLGNYLYRVFEGDRQPLPRLFGAMSGCSPSFAAGTAAATGLETVHRGDARVQRAYVAGDLRHRAAATYLAVESAEFSPGAGGPGI